MDAAAQAGWWSWRRVALLAAVAVLAGLVATALGLFFWARAYAPLQNNVGGAPLPSVEVRQQTAAMISESVYLVRPERTTIRFGVWSDGRWPVDIDGFELESAPPGALVLERVAVRDPRELPTSMRSLPSRDWKLHVARGEPGFDVNATFRINCDALPAGTYSVPMTQMRVHYRYQHVFARTDNVPLYTSVVLRC